MLRRVRRHRFNTEYSPLVASQEPRRRRSSYERLGPAPEQEQARDHDPRRSGGSRAGTRPTRATKASPVNAGCGKGSLADAAPARSPGPCARRNRPELLLAAVAFCLAVTYRWLTRPRRMQHHGRVHAWRRKSPPVVIPAARTRGVRPKGPQASVPAPGRSAARQVRGGCFAKTTLWYLY